MDALAPPLRALLFIKLKIQSGLSIRESIREYTQENIHCSFAKDLAVWFFQIEAGQEVSLKPFSRPFRKMLIETFTRGLQGDSILKSLEALEEDMIEASQADMERQLQKLPLLTMIPLLFLQLPAFLILVFGPLILRLIHQMGVN